MGLGDGKRLWQSQSLSFYDTWEAVAFQIKSFTFAGKHIYQDIRMKKVLKLAGGFMVGACIGFVGIIGVRVLVLGDSFDGLHSKFAETGNHFIIICIAK